MSGRTRAAPGLSPKRVIKPVTCAIALLVGLAGCGGGGGEEVAPPSSVGVSDGLALAQIERLILQEAPSGFLRLSDESSGTGPFDLETAVAAQASQGSPEDVRAFFELSGFTGGYQRMWTELGTDLRLTVFLYLYSSPQGAGAQATLVRETSTTQNPGSITEFSPDVADADGFLFEDGGIWLGAVSFTKGDYWAMVQLEGLDRDDTLDLAERLAQAQFDRLP